MTEPEIVPDIWWKVASSSDALPEEGRLHTSINGRFITVFRHKGVIGSIDSTCYHAGGPLALGEIKDIEELGMAVVSCPWHRFMVSITDGCKAYQAVDIVDGKSVIRGWTKGTAVHRAHKVKEDADGIYVALNSDPIQYPSDKDSKNVNCVRTYRMHSEIPVKLEEV